jgi:hypothetical protein
MGANQWLLFPGDTILLVGSQVEGNVLLKAIVDPSPTEAKSDCGGMEKLFASQYFALSLCSKGST